MADNEQCGKIAIDWLWISRHGLPTPANSDNRVYSSFSLTDSMKSTGLLAPIVPSDSDYASQSMRSIAGSDDTTALIFRLLCIGKKKHQPCPGLRDSRSYICIYVSLNESNLAYCMSHGGYACSETIECTLQAPCMDLYLHES